MTSPTGRGLMIRELPEGERPREKLMMRGPGALSDAELLAIIVNTGSKGESVMSLSQRIIKESGGTLRGLMQNDLDSLQKMKGLGPAKAIKILAALEIGRRVAAITPEDHPQIRTPEDIARIFLPKMVALDHEELHVALFDTKHRYLRAYALYSGSVNSAQVRASEIFQEAIRTNAPAIAIIHNHPSGDPTPSAEDVSLTADLNKAAGLLDIELIDHLIIGDGQWTSMRRLGLGFPTSS